jgi:hypothetical protein
MWYGLTKNNFFSGLTVFGAIGAIAALAGVVNSFVKGSAIVNYWALVAILIFIPSLWILLFAVLSITSLKIENAELKWYAWRRFLLLQCPVQSVLAIGPGSFSAVIIQTKAGNIHLFGLHRKDRMSLSQHLLELNPAIRWAD